MICCKSQGTCKGMSRSGPSASPPVDCIGQMQGRHGDDATVREWDA